MDPSPDQWSALGAVAPRALTPSRLSLHYAAQPMAATALAVLPAVDDHSHTNLLWSKERDGFVGRTLPSGHRAFLDVVGLRTGLLTDEDDEVAAIELAGETLPAAMGEMGQALAQANEQLPPDGLALPSYDLPDSPLNRGEAFPPRNGAALGELGRWFGNAALVLADVATTLLDDGEVRCWPHHFDLAVLRTLDPDKDAESARSVGAGFSPGDDHYAEPYFYVAPWPYPDTANLPSLPGGAHWHTEGFTSAVLTGSHIVAAGDARAQHQRVDEVLRSGIHASLELLGADTA